MKTSSITAGLSRETALQIFTELVNSADTLFVFLKTMPEKVDQMRALLHDPLTRDEAYALNDVLFQRRRFADMIAWLRDDPISWDGYFIRAEFRADEADRLLIEQWRREDDARAKEIELQKNDPGWTELHTERVANAKAHYLHSAHPCPTCGTPAEFLEWSDYMTSSSRSGRLSGGWQTNCRFCLCVVDEFTNFIGTRRRRLSPRPSASRRNNLPA